MKCSIIRDLLPLYCDRLTSEESSREIESHLNECTECMKIYRNMCAKENINISDKNIMPLKKVKSRNIRKIIISVIGTAVILTLVFIFVFWGIVPVSSDKAEFEISAGEFESEEIYSGKNGETVSRIVKRQDITLDFTVDCQYARFRTEPKYIYNPDGSVTVHHEMWIYSAVKFPFDNHGEHPNTFEFGGNVSEGDTLTIHYLDKSEEYDLYRMYLENCK